EGTKIGGQGSAFKIGTEGLPSDRRKTQLFWVRIAHKQTSCGFYGMDVSHLPFYQRLTRGFCFFFKNPRYLFWTLPRSIRYDLARFCLQGRLRSGLGLSP